MALEFKFDKMGEGEEPHVTTFAFSVAIDDLVIWPVSGIEDAKLDIQIDDLLAHLVEFWKPLLLQQTYPLGLNPARPSKFRLNAEERWEDSTKEQAEEEDAILESFQDCHDLSRCFAGYFDLPPLWFMRSGNDVLIDTGAQTYRVEFEAARATLERAGNWISQQLAGTGSDRWTELLSAWDQRNAGEGIRLLRLLTGLDDATTRYMADRGLLSVPASVEDAANDNDEVRLAARMASALPPEDIKAVLERVLRFASSQATELDELAEQAKTHIETLHGSSRPYEQGEQLAGFLRARLPDVGEESVEIFAIVQNLGVEVLLEDMGLPALDALAIWGERHGPVALINSGSSRHAGPGAVVDRGSVRVTLAHELAHFLIDREHALGAVDVLQSRMPVATEQRARAFAAEFLLPSRLAGATWAHSGRPLDRAGLQAVIDDLCERFAVSKSVASWKLEHGARQYGGDVRLMLSAIVPQR